VRCRGCPNSAVRRMRRHGRMQRDVRRIPSRPRCAQFARRPASSVAMPDRRPMPPRRFARATSRAPAQPMPRSTTILPRGRSFRCRRREKAVAACGGGGGGVATRRNAKRCVKGARRGRHAQARRVWGIPVMPRRCMARSESGVRVVCWFARRTRMAGSACGANRRRDARWWHEDVAAQAAGGASTPLLAGSCPPAGEH